MSDRVLKGDLGVGCAINRLMVCSGNSAVTRLIQQGCDLRDRDGVVASQNLNRGVESVGATEPERFEIAHLSFVCDHEFPHPVVCASDGRGAPALAKVNSQPRRVLPEFSQRSVGPCRGGSRPDLAEASADQGAPRPSIWGRLRALDDRINDCWVGDLLGVVLLFLILFAAPVALPILSIICGGNP